MVVNAGSYGNDYVEKKQPVADSRPLQLLKAIDDFEYFLLCEKEGEIYKFLVSAIEKALIEKMLERTDGNQLKTARILGINRNTLHTKITRLKINVDKFKVSRSVRRYHKGK